MNWVDDVKTFGYYAGAALTAVVAYDQVLKPVARIAGEYISRFGADDEEKATVRPTPQAHNKSAA